MGIRYIFLSLFFLGLVSSVVFAQDTYLGIPVFPGAEETESVTAAYEGVDVGLKTYQTTASFEEVVKFYKQKLPKAIFSSMEEEGEKNAVFQLVEEESIKLVTISQVEGEDVTTIAIMRQF